MNIEELVPPPKLCRKIPAGEFQDSLHWYRWSWVDQKYLLDAGKPDVRLYREPCPCGMKYFYPAPTLQEIMVELPPGDTGCFCCYQGDGEWSMGDCERDLYVKNGTEGSNPAASALKLWLKLKGIKDGK